MIGEDKEYSCGGSINLPTQLKFYAFSFLFDFNLVLKTLTLMFVQPSRRIPFISSSDSILVLVRQNQGGSRDSNLLEITFGIRSGNDLLVNCQMSRTMSQLLCFYNATAVIERRRDERFCQNGTPPCQMICHQAPGIYLTASLVSVMIQPPL